MIKTTEAHNQWLSRPDDERFDSLSSLNDWVETKRRASRAYVSDWSTLRVVTTVEPGSLRLTGPTGVQARMTHWSFSQLCRGAGAPAEFVRSLPVPLAADVLTDCLSRTEPRPVHMLGQNGSKPLTIRAAVSESYVRIWDDDVTRRLMRLGDEGWKVPPARPVRVGQAGSRPATADDVIAGNTVGIAIRVGDTIAPAGLYGSDRDLWVMLMREEPIDDGHGSPLFPLLIVSNSEVGAKSFRLSTGLVQGVCGNHLLWGLKQVADVRIRHVGTAEERALHELHVTMRHYRPNEGQVTGQIKAARAKMLGRDKEEVLDLLFGLKSLGLSRKTLDAAYEVAYQEEDRYHASPTSVWGMVSGLTQHSQTLAYQDAREAVDTAAAKVMALAF